MKHLEKPVSSLPGIFTHPMQFWIRVVRSTHLHPPLECLRASHKLSLPPRQGQTCVMQPRTIFDFRAQRLPTMEQLMMKTTTPEAAWAKEMLADFSMDLIAFVEIGIASTR